MSEKRTLSAERRTTDFGSAGARRVLRNKRIPAVIYGKKKNPIHITLDSREFHNKVRFFSETALLKIVVGKTKYECLMKAYQENLIRGEIKHVDFYEVTRGQVLRAMVNIVLTGSPIGTHEGGVLEQVMHEVEIECLPENLPDTIHADVSKLGLNEVLHLSEVVFPENVKVLEELNRTVASVKAVKEEVVEEVAEEVEVIDAAPADDEEDKAKK
ncbi:MAG: 50S ribosomal protein L25 [Spirochaetia bacterium]|jgi:large subunit ribosomal protein L25|nr:50S ribosomal protein L25 [Spirochaetia bacterium]